MQQTILKFTEIIFLSKRRDWNSATIIHI